MAVGELFLAAFFQVLFDRLASRELLQFLTQEGLNSKIKRWEKKLKMIEAVLIDAEEKQLTDRAIQMWLDDLQDLAFDVEDILDEFATEALGRKLRMEEHQASCSKVGKFVPVCFTGLTPTLYNFSFSTTGSKIDDVTSRLEELCNKRTELGLEKIAGQRSTASWQRPATTCLPTEPAVYGRDKDKARILELVLSDGPGEANFGVIPLVGMGGIGKTTLAQEVYNDKAPEDFNPKAWVCVSDDFDVLRISKAILESITSVSCDVKELNAVQLRLKKTINGKKFLLVLDDVWSKNYDAWETLKSPFMFGAQGSKIIITTRLQEVASTMRPGGDYELELLSDDNCWLVFMKHAFEDRNTVAHQDLKIVQQKVVQKCKDLPLVARTLGGLLCSKQKDEWHTSGVEIKLLSSPFTFKEMFFLLCNFSK